MTFSSPRVPCVFETARRPDFSLEQQDNTNTPTGVPVGAVHDPCMNAGGTPGGDADKIGTATINGITDCKVGHSSMFTVSFTGGVDDATYAWSYTTNSSSPAASDFTVGSGTASTATTNPVEANFKGTGDLVIQCVISSATATDSPVTVTKNVTVTAA
jgi:hypothetical protein